MKEEQIPNEEHLENSEPEKKESVPQKKKGMGCGNLILLADLLVFILIVAAFSLPFWGAKTRAKVPRVEFDLRHIAMALENYSIDNNRYPEMMKGNAFPIHVLTSPVAYLSGASIAKDLFIEETNQTYHYLLFDKQNIFILLSNGPDKDQDITMNLIQENVDLENIKELNDFLESLAYDPSNGLKSDGDIFNINKDFSWWRKQKRRIKKNKK